MIWHLHTNNKAYTILNVLEREYYSGFRISFDFQFLNNRDEIPFLEFFLKILTFNSCFNTLTSFDRREIVEPIFYTNIITIVKACYLSNIKTNVLVFLLLKLHFIFLHFQNNFLCVAYILTQNICFMQILRKWGLWFRHYLAKCLQ